MRTWRRRLAGAVLLAAWAGAAGAHRLDLEGEVVQGGLLLGRAEPGAEVRVGGERVRVSAQGHFLVGFGRDEQGTLPIEVRYADGTRKSSSLRVARREYRIQRIDGLPKRKVTPSAEDLERIRREAALARKARQRDDGRTDFLGGFAWPVTGPISGVYGSQRILNGQPRRPHFGVDVAVPTGTPVRAPAPGIVTLAHPDMFFSGGTLILDHGHRLTSSFLHLSRILVAEGQRVERGELIAEVGATGRVTGAHLDWRMNLGKRRIAPALLAGPMPGRE